jgi:predicted O-methyltransferase YrrM
MNFLAGVPMKNLFIDPALRMSEIVLAPLTLLGGVWLGLMRRYGIHKLPVTRTILKRIGVFPIRDHYYEPMFNFAVGSGSDGNVRPLPGLDLNVDGQLEFLSRFRFQDELRDFPRERTAKREFFYDNVSFGPGDAEYLYSLIRLVKPRRIIEIGCGSSTLMIRNAVNRNRAEDPAFDCDHTCIEPYENPWLEELEVKLIRRRLEELPASEFDSLDENDILFIDTSHVIRPGGEVLYAYLDILPRIKPGVFVHIHDIFTPFDYPDQWMRHFVRFWNEQYLFEAFLSGNPNFVTVGTLFYLSQRHSEEVAEKLPILASTNYYQPTSFWIQRRK